MDNKVSIIITTYKTNQSLEQAIISAMNQSYLNTEIIVVDDNKPETNYREITKTLQKRYPSVKFIFHHDNQNGAVARNTGVSCSSGDYVCFLDDDDCFYDTKVEKQVDFLKTNPQYDVVYCWRIAKHGNTSTRYSHTGDLRKDILMMRSDVQTSTIMLKRDAYEKVEGFDGSFFRHQDFEFMIRICEYYSVGVVKEILVRSFDNTVDNVPKKLELEQLKNQFLMKFDALINTMDKNEKGFKKEVYSIHMTHVFLSYVKHGCCKDAIRVLAGELKRSQMVFIKQILIQTYVKTQTKIHRKRNQDLSSKEGMS